jgi:trans-aconitate methyltransferase
MTPADPIEAFMFLGGFVAVFGLPLLGVLAFVEWLLGPPAELPMRLDRLDEHERDLLGDDWRDSVAHLFPITNDGRYKK